jgi:hypothetical protein
MKKIPMVFFSIFFYSLTAAAGQPASLLTVPFRAVVFVHPLLHSKVSPIVEIDRELPVQGSIQNRKVTTVKKMNFRSRLAYRIMSKRIKRAAYLPGDDLTKADKMAKTSRTLGIIALILAIIPFFTIVAAIPLGIIAISKASKAKKMGSKKKTGKVLGIVALSMVALWIIFVAIIAASGGIFLGGF